MNKTEMVINNCYKGFLLSEMYYKEAVLPLEEGMDFTTKKWNLIQKQLWLHMVDDGLVKRNDPIAFYAFGEYFRDYYDKHGHVVPYSQLVAHVGGY